MDQILIKLKAHDQPDEFELSDKNLLRVRVQLPSGEMIYDSNYRVELSFSQDAMLGLATELLRHLYKEDNQQGFWHFRPATPNFSSQQLGLYLHPQSCELLISEVDHGTLQSQLDNELAKK
jgi:hypothetical protein